MSAGIPTSVTVSVLAVYASPSFSVNRALTDWRRQGYRAEPQPCLWVLLSRTNTPT